MPFKIDHVTLASSNLKTLVDEFSAAGMTPDYGGVHSSGLTHMSLLGFSDGSYIELISTVKAGMQGARWGQHISTDGGPCAWAVEVSDIAQHAARLAEKGVWVDGPTYVHRQRPDGKLVEWDLAFVGTEGPGALHPFLIEDRTPKGYRVQVAKSVRDGPLTGVATIVIAVADLESAINEFREVYGLARPVSLRCSFIPGSLQVFPGAPLALISNDKEDDWVAQRIKRYGASPCAYLLRATNLVEVRRRYGFPHADRLGEADILWMNNPLIRIGVCDVDLV